MSPKANKYNNTLYFNLLLFIPGPLTPLDQSVCSHSYEPRTTSQPINSPSFLITGFFNLNRNQTTPTMPVPFEGLLPYAIMTAFFGLAGHGVGFIRYWDNGWKNDRWDLDAWDEKMMARDQLLTGTKRGQTSEAIAPEHFKTSHIVQQTYWTPYKDQFFTFRERLYRGYVSGSWDFS